MTEAEVPRPAIRHTPLVDVTDVIDDLGSLTVAANQLRAGDGPIAIDAERASGYRYFQRAYLIQLYRRNAPIVLIDPIGLDLTPLRELLNELPWILHAATQDLPCLNELDLYPPDLFDTELAAKILGYPKVGLAALTESLLDISLAKEHSAVNWSIRPLQASWLSYAALDVELLPELMDKLLAELERTGRMEWASQEFIALKTFRAKLPQSDQWRRISGLHELAHRRQKAIARELWLVRDEIARELDLAPGRLLNDRIIVALTKVATQKVITAEDVKKLVRNPAQDYLNQWLVAIESAKTLAETELPRSTKREDSIPNPKSWEEIKPTAAVRWDKYRPAANELAAELEISPEVLVSPDLLRRYCWEDDEVKLQAEIEARLIELGSRRWAANLLAEKFASL